MTHHKKPLELGHSTIDNHHKELFHLTSTLDNAIRNQDDQKLDDIIDFLEHYVMDHFQEEEDLMKTNQFEGYQYHKDQHDVFRALVAEIRESYKEGTYKTHVIFKVRQFADKLVYHILNVDVRLSEIIEE